MECGARHLRQEKFEIIVGGIQAGLLLQMDIKNYIVFYINIYCIHRYEDYYNKAL